MLDVTPIKPSEAQLSPRKIHLWLPGCTLPALPARHAFLAANPLPSTGSTNNQWHNGTFHRPKQIDHTQSPQSPFNSVFSQRIIANLNKLRYSKTTRYSEWWMWSLHHTVSYSGLQYVSTLRHAMFRPGGSKEARSQQLSLGVATYQTDCSYQKRKKRENVKVFERDRIRQLNEQLKKWRIYNWKEREGTKDGMKKV